MASGQQIAKQNFEKFQSWIEERSVSDDWRDYIRGAYLNRTEIARECGFALSALRQNPAIKSLLTAKEEELKAAGILSGDRADANESSAAKRASQSTSKDKARIKALEEQNAAQKAQIVALEESLRRFKLFDEHLAETGRVLPL